MIGSIMFNSQRVPVTLRNFLKSSQRASMSKLRSGDTENYVIENYVMMENELFFIRDNFLMIAGFK
jgi:hypothetical protein